MLLEINGNVSDKRKQMNRCLLYIITRKNDIFAETNGQASHLTLAQVVIGLHRYFFYTCNNRESVY